MRQITDIIIHCSATREGQDFTVADIDRWHKERGWKGIGYHYVIYLDGSVHKGRPDAEIGAHCQGYNSHSIGICYIGGVDARGNAKDTRTQQQKDALGSLIKELKQKYPSIKSVKGHRDYSPDLNHNGKIEPNEWIKSCPCFDAQKEYENI